METRWYVMRDGKRHNSSFQSKQLKEAALRGHLKPTDMVQRHGENAWYLAESISGLFTPIRLDEAGNKQGTTSKLNAVFPSKLAGSIQHGVGVTCGAAIVLLGIYVMFLTETGALFWKRTFASASLTFSESFTGMLYSIPFIVIGAIILTLYSLYSRRPSR